MQKTNLLSAIVGGLIVVVVGGFVFHFVSAPQLSGDFPGGIVPSQLWSANSAASTVSPIGSFAVGATNGMDVGGTSATNQISLIGVGTSSFNTTVFGAIGVPSSTATSSLTLQVGGFSVGDYCEISLTSVPTSTSFTAKGYVTVAGATTSSVSISFGSGNSSAVTVSTGTVHAECHHYAI